MIIVDQQTAEALLAEAMDELPKIHMQALKNVAIVWEDEPSMEDLNKLHVGPGRTLLGLYHGVPLTQRQGRINDYPPGKIILYRGPIYRSVNSLPELKEQLKHTLWHEIAHYYGLNHSQISELDGK